MKTQEEVDLDTATNEIRFEMMHYKLALVMNQRPEGIQLAGMLDSKLFWWYSKAIEWELTELEASCITEIKLRKLI